ncbi:NAD(P)-binding protein [Xylariaceae sp. AK1471]|nr:NAD(P)-binding protein [Xylariaceae sp. AK1471]
MMNNRRVALVVGASRGIGRQVAIDLALAKERYCVVVAAKSTSDAQSVVPFPPDPNSPQSTISTVEREIREAGGSATAIAVDVREFESVKRCVDKTIEIYGRLDVVVYNSGAIWWASVEDTPMKRFQLMQRVNPEGLYGTVQASLPHLKKHGKGRIIVVSPPIYSRFFRGKTAYAMGKVGMSVLTKGLAMDFQRQGLTDMAITSIWPAVAIESAATRKMTEKNPREAQDLRKATIFSDAIIAMLRAPASSVNGRLELDEDYLWSDAGVTDFSKYSVIPGASPRRIMPAQLPDLTVKEQEDEGKRMNSAEGKAKL